MMDRLDNPSKIKASSCRGASRPSCGLCTTSQDDIITGEFSKGMMADWDNDDKNLFKWRAGDRRDRLREDRGLDEHPEQEYFDNAVLMVAMVKVGVELAYGHE
jgi:ketol-acid reductoisomerase